MAITSERVGIATRPPGGPAAAAGFDLDAYFARIGYAGGRAPTLDTLRDNVPAVHRSAGGTERRALATVAELRAALEETFLLTLPEAPEIDLALGGLIARAAQSEG